MVITENIIYTIIIYNMTRWTDFVKSFAKENNITYGCALSDPDCSAGYKAKYGVKKPLGKKKETESMMAEDINRVIAPPRKTPERKEKISSLKSSIKQKQNKTKLQKQLVETIGMMNEDINRNPVQDIAGNFVGNRPRAYTLPTEETLERERAGMTAEDKPKKKSKGGRKKGSKNKPKVAPAPENISMVIEEVKVKEQGRRGRPKKYATAEEARKAKIANTIAGAKRRKEKKSEGKGIIDTIKKGAKAIFKRTNPVEYALLTGASNIVKNPTAVIYGRNDFPPKVRQILSKYGNKNIIGITLGRTPLGAPLMTALQVASGNTFQQKLDNTPYDKLFHLFMCIELAGGSKIMIEKNEVINAVLGCKLQKETETIHISSSDIPTGLTLNDALEKQRERMGDNFFSYSADNNCQDFILDFLRANNLGSETDASWVKQETKVLFEGNERLRKIANTLTGIAASFDVIKEGKGFFDDVVSGLNKINPVMLGIKNKPDVGIKLGKITNDNLLPAVVEVGKPVYDATAIAAATTLTGNPVLGKVVADQFWEKFGKPYDPRSRQDNDALKKISKEVGNKAGSKADTIIKGKGFSKKKSNSNTKMANKWITYVKDYAKKHNMKYTDALKDPKCKAGYKSGMGMPMPDEKSIEHSPMTTMPVKPRRPIRTLPKEGMGMPTSRDAYIAELYDQANLGANGRVNL